MKTDEVKPDQYSTVYSEGLVPVAPVAPPLEIKEEVLDAEFEVKPQGREETPPASPIKTSDIPVTLPNMVGSGLTFFQGGHGVSIHASPNQPGVRVWNEDGCVAFSFAGASVRFVLAGDVVAEKVVSLNPAPG